MNNPEIGKEQIEAIQLNYARYKAEPQERVKGQLVNPVTQMFEIRMNRALDEYSDLLRFVSKAAILDMKEAA